MGAGGYQRRRRGVPSPAMTDPTAPTPPDVLFDVSGKTVVVTGGTRGIGRMIAGGFVAAGADVVIASRKADAVEAAVAELVGVRLVHGAGRRPLHRGGRPGLRRGGGRRPRPGARPGQQRRCDLGGAAGRARHRVVGPGAQSQRPGRVPHHQVLPAAARGGVDPRRPVPGDQHRVDRRDPRPGPRVLLVLVVEGRRPPAHPAPGPAPGPRHHGQRRGPGTVRVEDDGRHARGVRGADRRVAPR